MNLIKRAKKVLGFNNYEQIFGNVHALRFFDGGPCLIYTPPEGEQTTIGYDKLNGKYQLRNGHTEDLTKGLKKVEIYGFDEKIRYKKPKEDLF